MIEYEFRYKLNDHPEDIEIENLEDFYKQIIVSLLGIVKFRYGKNVVDINGFSFINSHKVVPLFSINKNENEMTLQNDRLIEEKDYQNE